MYVDFRCSEHEIRIIWRKPYVFSRKLNTKFEIMTFVKYVWFTKYISDRLCMWIFRVRGVLKVFDFLALGALPTIITHSEGKCFCFYASRGHSKTTWTRFWPFVTTYLNVDIFYPKRGQKEALIDHPTTSSCPRSFWTTS